jgi:uncharacterized protein
MMSDTFAVETGAMGRVAHARIEPNEDLVLGVEKLCLAEGFRNAFVRGALGSLVDACLGTLDGNYLQIKGPAVEIVSLAGEVRSTGDRSLQPSLTGVVADTEGNVYGGPFIAGSNPICVTFEVTLEEWLHSQKHEADFVSRVRRPCNRGHPRRMSQDSPFQHQLSGWTPRSKGETQ